MQSLKRTNDQATKKYTIERNERKKECGMTKHIKRKVQSAQIPHWIECCEENEKKIGQKIGAERSNRHKCATTHISFDKTLPAQLHMAMA